MLKQQAVTKAKTRALKKAQAVTKTKASEAVTKAQTVRKAKACSVVTKSHAVTKDQNLINRPLKKPERPISGKNT
jgi:hypothetical protein